MEMDKFLKVLVKKYGGIRDCLGTSDSLTGFSGIAVKPGSVFFFFGAEKSLD